jgi:Kef-type K+ transport system membrane component KefB
VSFGILTVVVLAGLAGPLVSSSDRILVPVVVGELVAGILVGRTGFEWVQPDDPTTAFLASIGFAMLMFSAGMAVPVRQPALARELGHGAVRAAIAAAFAVAGGFAAARIVGVPHAAIYALVLASGSAAVLVPSLEEAKLLELPAALGAAAQVAVADVASIVALPLVVQPHRAVRALLGALAVAACAAALLVVARTLKPHAPVRRLRRLSKRRDWALDLRLALLVLFALCWLATRIGTSILVAGFAVGLVVAATGGPKRLSRQVTGIGQGFFIPLFFVVLGARIDVRALGSDPALIGLAALLVAFDVAARLVTGLLTRQAVPPALAATVQLGVPAAVVQLGLTLNVLTPGQGAAIMAAALASIAISGTGVSLLEHRAAPAPPAPAPSPSGA